MYQKCFRLVAMICFTILASSSMVQAGTPILEITNKDGSVHFAVTDELIAKVGLHSYKAILPSTDGAVQDVSGPLLRDIIKESGLSGTEVMAKALDDYEMAVPAEDYNTYDVILAITIDGKRLTVRDKGPAWVVYPTVDHPELKADTYQARSVWQIKELIVQ